MQKGIYLTHGGINHLDEITGYAILKMAGFVERFELLQDTSEEVIERVRQRYIEKGWMVFVGDIGRRYDPSERLFDHHQGGVVRPDGLNYATAGLLWEHCSEMAILNLFRMNGDQESYKGFMIEPDDTRWIADRVDWRLIRGIDANDADPDYWYYGHSSVGEVEIVDLPSIVRRIGQVNGDKQYLFESMAGMMQLLIQSQIEAAIKYLQLKKDFDDMASVILDGKALLMNTGFGWDEFCKEEYPEIMYAIQPSNHPGARWSLVAQKKDLRRREVMKPIERPDWFDGFIHNGKWIAGHNDFDKLVELAQWNIER